MPAGSAGPDDHSPLDGSKTSTSDTASPRSERPPASQMRPSWAATAISSLASGASGELRPGPGHRPDAAGALGAATPAPGVVGTQVADAPASAMRRYMRHERHDRDEGEGRRRAACFARVDERDSLAPLGRPAPGRRGGDARGVRGWWRGRYRRCATSHWETRTPSAPRWPRPSAGRTSSSARIDELELAGNPAVNGFTSADLINDELPQLDALRPELASVLIGVNDVVQGVPDSQYAGNVAIILEELLTRLPPNRILCIATPDYTVTPSGAAFGDPAHQSDAIVRFNAILREACEHREVRFVPEIFEISQAALDDPSLVADDGLHPSGKQYSLWVDAIEPVVRELIAG